jgi:hypothetical protein
MIIAAITGAALIVSVSADPLRPFSYDAGTPGGNARTSVQQKAAAIRPLIRSANDCVVRRVSADPRFHRPMKDANNIGMLIVDSMKTCQDAMRAMIDAHDRLFGAGSGEAFFMGPYLDVLPATVNRLIDQGGE